MTDSQQGPATRGLRPALFLVALATIMLEVLLPRIFSLTMWYHFAFLAISIAMFGMTAGALLVFLRPARWSGPALRQAMGRSALLLAASMAGVLMLHISLYLPSPAVAMGPIVLTFIGAAVPFVFSGIFVCLALTRFPARVAQLYAVDLAGAAAGCLAVIAALHWLDGVGAVFACATLAALAALPLLEGRQRVGAALVTALLGGAALWSGIHLARHDVAAFKIDHIKTSESADVEYERWNSFSRVAVLKADSKAVPAWSLSTAFPGPLDVTSRWLHIDSVAGSQLVGFDGDLAKVEFLRWDLPNFVHHLRRDARVAVVGAGGARDVLTARLFGQKRVLAVEINDNVLHAVNQRFGEFTGRLDRLPGVTFVNDEARSYLARQRDKFDIVELTFVDTFAATAAGAYTLTESTLYTVEGWQVFLDRLEEDGLLAVSRGVGAELGRLVSLGRAALLAVGAAQPERHMVVVTNRLARSPHSAARMGLLLVRRTPFGEAELAQIRGLAADMKFAVELEAGASQDSVLRGLALGRAGANPLPLNYDAPTDDQPFFFNMDRPAAWLLMQDRGSPATLLTGLLLSVALLTLACIVLPLALAKTKLARGDAMLLAFFAAIGTGFMLVEVSMLQRLTVFLGHPTYSLSVILFVLLLSGGLGSYLSGRIADSQLRSAGLRTLAALVAVLLAAGAATPSLVAAFRDAETPVRIAVSGALLAVMGVVMGTAFPLGMRLAMASRQDLTPWLWGINGATSVLASVLGAVIAMAVGISASFWSGVAAYVAALGAFAAATRAARVSRAFV